MSALKIPVSLAVLALVMFGFGFGLVSLYELFCQVTGFGGGRGLAETTIEEVSQWEVNEDRDIRVLMVTKRGRGARTFLSPVKDQVIIHTGQVETVFFRLKNPTTETLVARAIPSIAPASVAQYLKKIECFCFNEQTIEAGGELLLPMRFIISEDMPDSAGDDVVVSYTLFDQTI